MTESTIAPNLAAQLRQRLQSVRTRQHHAVVGQCGVTGLILGTVLGACLAVARMHGGAVSSSAVVLTSVGGLIVGLMCGWLQVPAWKQSANAIDSYYRLKDRAATALEFVDCPHASEIHDLVVRDALEHLNVVNVDQLISTQIPRRLPVAAILFVAVAALACVPLSENIDTGVATAKVIAERENIFAEAEFLQDTMLNDLKELANQTSENAELEPLVDQLAAMIDEMKSPSVDKRQALAQLSRMQAAIAAVQAAFNLERVDANMRALGTALSAAKSLQGAANALHASQYEQAAIALESIDPSELSPQEANTISKELSEFSEQMADAGLDELSNATSEFANGLDSDNEAMIKNGAEQLAELSRKYGLRKSVGQNLAMQIASLGESKANVGQNGGSMRNPKSEPSNNWGRGSEGTPLGQATPEIDSTLQQEQLSGTAGEGPSEREVTHAVEGREMAARQQREVYNQYRKQAEEVLQNEALPMGHRQTIRRYFEAIRPENDD